MDNDMRFIVSNLPIKLSKFLKFIFFMLGIIIIFLLKYEITLYNTYEARIIKEGDDYYVQVFVPMDEQAFIHNKTFLVGDDEYNYKIENIGEEYVSYNNKNYMLVNIKTNLDESYYIENNYLTVKQNNKKQTLFKIIFNKLKKGMNL